MKIGEQRSARRWWGRAAVGFLLAIAMALAAGCGSGSGSSEPSAGGGSNSAASASNSAAMLKFARCMREHGVDVPDPEAGSGRIKIAPRAGFSPGHLSPKVEKAQKACSRYQPGPGSFSQADQRKFQDAALKFARCMRKHGVDFPDPDFSNGAVGLIGSPTANPKDPKVQAAAKACQGILPTPPGQ
jgi:hypothetical protein